MCTLDGEANWLTTLLQAKSAGLPLGTETASDHAPFQLSGIPAVQLTQMGRGYLYHSAADTAENLNVWTIAGAARAAAAAVTEIVSADTASYRTVARQQGDGYAYPMLRETTIYFASSLEETESYIGASGELVNTETISGEGWEDVYTTYRYSMRWFGGEKPMNTYYLYRNGYLEHVEVRPYETGYTAAQVESLMRAMYGEPTNVSDGVLDWEDATYSKFLSLAETDAGCVVNVTNYTLGITNILASYQVVDGEAQGITDPMHRSLWQLVCDILPKDARQRIVQFDLFTDGASNGLAYTAPIQNADGTTDNSRFSIAIDYYDAYHEDGTKGDWSKLIYTIIHEYGHALLEDNTQIDLTVGQDVHDPAGFIEGSFRKEFYDGSGRTWATPPSTTTRRIPPTTPAATAPTTSTRTWRTPSPCSCWAPSPRATPWRRRSCSPSGTSRRWSPSAPPSGPTWAWRPEPRSEKPITGNAPACHRHAGALILFCIRCFQLAVPSATEADTPRLVSDSMQSMAIITPRAVRTSASSSTSSR